MTTPLKSIVVAVDAEHTRQSSAGIARYARGLVGALAKRSDVSVFELGGGDLVPRGTIRKRLLTVRQDFLWYPSLGRHRADAAGADIYHVPLPRGPLTRGKPPLVLTVHDLVPLLFPETMTPWSRIYSRLTLRRLLDVADRIITPSWNTADALVSLLHVSRERIRVVHNGVDDFFFEGDNRSEGGAVGHSSSQFESSVTRDVLGLNEPYVLFVGTPEPRKNLPRLVAAMTKLRQRGFSHRLVVAGAGGWGHPTGTDADPSDIHRLGRISDIELRYLYANAACLALPSLHEGFGLPAIEAMASGTPVVAARAGALPEVTGDAAVLVNPLDVDDIADGIERCISERESFAAAGRKRARDFSWDRAAAATLEVYRELI